ncbi:glycosyltransferase [Clostridium botulinum]|uniref:glycosyltransferase n=1 Tax=Clostridium botulinum TaxID=1491 RepID=UPI003DA26B26
MNDKKICFITCINDDRQYEECLLYINNLNIPKGYEIDTISVKEAKSMAAGYNAAMQDTDAKYKVYLHQDTYVINKNFIYDMLDVFNSDKKIGMIGVMGATTIPTNGIWLESIHKYGQVYESRTGNMKLLALNEPKNDYEEVKAINGLIMATQYDILWREDIFGGWSFYDLAQSVEFTLAGYKVVIPKQNDTWCVHECGNSKNDYDKYKNKFLEQYSKNIFPLVSVLIPTYNRPEYFKEALESVINQTYRNIEIIIGDDSTNDETENLIKENYLNNYDNIKYYHNKKNLGQFDNDLKLYDIAEGQFINFLMDDDLFEITKIEKMMNYFMQDPNEEFSLVTSHRGIIDDDGNIMQTFGDTNNIFKKNTIISGIELGNFVLKMNFNCIGEPTTVLFRKNKLKEPFGIYNNRRYGCNVDQATWFNLLSNGNAVFINEVLSYFRMHKDQQQNDLKIKLMGFTDYIHSILTCKKNGFLLNSDEYLESICNCLNVCEEYIIKPLEGKKIEMKEYREFEEYHKKLKVKLKEVNHIQNIDEKGSLANSCEKEPKKLADIKDGNIKNAIMKRKIMFSCITTYHMFVAYILSKTVYKDDYKIILVASGHNDYEKICKNMCDLNIWEEIVLINEKNGDFNFVKNQLESVNFNDIDILHYFSWGSIANYILLEFVMPHTIVNLTDEGAMTYIIKESVQQWAADTKSSKMPLDFNKISEIWLFDKRLFISDIDIPLREIEFKKYIDTDLKYVFRDELNYIFGYEHKRDKFDIVFFDQYLTLSGQTNFSQEKYLLMNIARLAKGLNLIIKKHPTDSANKYKGIEIDNILMDMVPWEVICLNYYIDDELNNRVFMTYASTAMLTNIFLFDNSLKNNTFIFLYNILNNLAGKNAGYENFNIFLNRIKDVYDISFVVPESFYEVKKYFSVNVMKNKKNEKLLYEEFINEQEHIIKDLLK